MLKVIAEFFIKEEAIDVVLPYFKQLVDETRKEPLCISYEFCVDQQDKSHFIFIEQWPDKNALDIHSASEHFQKLVPLIDMHKKQDARIILMDDLNW
ncbi:antibiotic biosynthesis monooxygenase [Bartonella sp. HY329]|uniref:putative quinol monooxygenase n=1 Tax=unclassified Bartonella TaxID=2645622 RepID=UPI0021C88825|nr:MULTISPECIES: putative quinol monooxygenase [unclassified Bartonella]UXM95890.1 antibiotic biosynthesis monooxygenase [Bartonella sp. HY329]UXN10215.1 antibiotic biosynthesis monooxygenase [Bartonella sp. HY328]